MLRGRHTGLVAGVAVLMFAVLVAAPGASAKSLTVVKVGETGKSRGITGFRATFSKALNRRRAQKVRNYRFVGVAANGRQIRIALRSAKYIPRRHAVRVKVKAPFTQTLFQQLRIRFKGRRGGLTAKRGGRLDGNRDGR